MKKLLLSILLCCISILCFSQHLSFMGIPINGTITSFQNKLIKKGIRPSSTNKYLPIGVRQFNGYFTNQNAHIYVFYNNKSKIVYMCRVTFDYIYNSKEEARDAFESYKEALGNKYDDVSLNSDVLDEDEQDPDLFSWAIMQPPIEPGAILLGYIELQIKDIDYTSYQLWIDYIDSSNQIKNDNYNNNDL